MIKKQSKKTQQTQQNEVLLIKDLCDLIFQYLKTPEELCSVARVCRIWNLRSSMNLCWKNLFPDDLLSKIFGLYDIQSQEKQKELGEKDFFLKKWYHNWFFHQLERLEKIRKTKKKDRYYSSSYDFSMFWKPRGELQNKFMND